VSIKYPVCQTGQTESHAIPLKLTVVDDRHNRSVDHLVKTAVVLQVKEQIAQDVQSTRRFIVTEGSEARYSLEVKIEQLNYEVPGYATRRAMNGVLSDATLGLSEFFTEGAGMSIFGHARVQAILSQKGNRVVFSESFPGQYTETA
jgi:hypothetical protein